MKSKLFSVFMLVCLVIGLAGPGAAVFAQGEQLPMQESKTLTLKCPHLDLEFSRDRDFLQFLPPECTKEYRHLLYQTSKPVEMLNATPAASGGPDDFGYIFDDTVAYGWISATTNSGLSGDDETAGPFNIGFNFPFYEQTPSQLYLDTNGLIAFDPIDSSFGGDRIPSMAAPNNFLAPFWDDLLIGSPDNSGGIYTMQGGTAPNRYFVIEWRDITTYSGSSPFSFEAILYENGDIVFQHQSLPGFYHSTVGIENSRGDDGLQYQAGSWGLSAPKAIRFYRPAAAARVALTPQEDGSFTQAGATASFLLTVVNTGGLGADTYDLTISSVWPLTLYAADGATLLTDTDDDTVLDTGAIPQGDSVDIIVKIAVPADSQLGANNAATLTATSSLNVSKAKTANLSLAVPAGFASVFKNDDNGAMSFMIASPLETSTFKTTADNYSGSGVAIERLVNGNYLYAWDKFHYQANDWDYEIEYAILSPRGNIIRPVTKLTDSSGDLIQTYNYSPSIAVAPNGVIGVIWLKRIYNSSYQFNENIYFATLDSSGNPLSGPTNLTNNMAWGTYGDLDVPDFYDQTIAATDDNRFIMSWIETINSGSPNSEFNVWYATRSTDGSGVFGPNILASINGNVGCTLNRLTGDKAILMWSDGQLEYAVINSNGSVFKTATNLSFLVDLGRDAVQLPNGKVAVAWTTDTGIQYAILNGTTYIIESGPYSLDVGVRGKSLSLTTDLTGHVIATWAERIWAGTEVSTKLFYTAVDSAGTTLTPPMIYEASASYIETGWNGQGNAPYTLLDISGNAGTGGVVLSYTDGSAKTVTADGSGHYTISVPFGWSGVVTPSKAGYGFVPANRTYTNVAGNLTAEDYTAILLPESFIKTSPANSMSDQPLAPTLSWESSIGATSYEYCYSSVPGPCTKWNSVGTDTSVALSGLAPKYTYYWQVRAVNTGGTTEADGGAWWSFTTTAAPSCTFPPHTIPTTASYVDVPMSHWAWNWIERYKSAGLTTGCSWVPGGYCPGDNVTREQMAVFIMRAKHCGNYTPATVTSAVFSDVPANHWAAGFIRDFRDTKITTGCAWVPGGYCPGDNVTREQMAVFIIRALHGGTYSPPAVTGAVFTDVPANHWAAAFIKQFFDEGITTGCSWVPGGFCPGDNVTREQMAVFIGRAFDLLP